MIRVIFGVIIGVIIRVFRVFPPSETFLSFLFQILIGFPSQVCYFMVCVTIYIEIWFQMFTFVHICSHFVQKLNFQGFLNIFGGCSFFHEKSHFTNQKRSRNALWAVISLISRKKSRRMNILRDFLLKFGPQCIASTLFSVKSTKLRPIMHCAHELT